MSQRMCDSPDNSSVAGFQLPENGVNRVVRWTGQEINNLKLAMSLFGDQAWLKIQRFLIQRDNDNRRSKQIKKERSTNYNKASPQGCNSSMGSHNMQTYRSVKAIQSKIYQIKQDFEKKQDEFDKLQELILKKKAQGQAK